MGDVLGWSQVQRETEVEHYVKRVDFQGCRFNGNTKSGLMVANNGAGCYEITLSDCQANDNGETREVLHQGIAARAFERRFQLADYVQVTGASLENGLLHIDLVREIPEAKKPRQIAIGGKPAKVLEAKAETAKAA